MGWKLPGVLRYLPSPTLVAIDHLQQTLAMLPVNAQIVDVGAGGRRIVPDVLTIDATPGQGVDLVADIHKIPLDGESVDCVVCTGTLEHVRDPRQVITEIQRILKPGGIVHIDVPFIQGYHPDPTDYWRFTLEGLKLLCKDFEELGAGVHIGPTSGVVWVLREWANSLSENRYLSNLFLIAVALLTMPLKYLDVFLTRSVRAHHVASAVYFRGRKRSVV